MLNSDMHNYFKNSTTHIYSELPLVTNYKIDHNMTVKSMLYLLATK